jgi:hypothetical protein
LSDAEHFLGNRKLTIAGLVVDNRVAVGRCAERHCRMVAGLWDMVDRGGEDRAQLVVHKGMETAELTPVPPID